MITEERLFTTGADGLTLHALEWSREGVPLVLLHGFGNEAHIWDDFAPMLAPHYRTLALDHRGHGDSDWDPKARYELEAMVRDLEAVTEALEIERLVLIGHSLGGRVATVFAGHHPERMAGLVLVDIGPDLDARGVTRIRMDIGTNRQPTFASVAEYASALSLTSNMFGDDQNADHGQLPLLSRIISAIRAAMSSMLPSNISACPVSSGVYMRRMR